MDFCFFYSPNWKSQLASTVLPIGFDINVLVDPPTFKTPGINSARFLRLLNALDFVPKTHQYI